ncbi:MAG: YbaB/EbfC family nucleoid-associated protein [Campylobacterales bacterium]|nr:YbaB/EbfC family nucleoid-associated protein [Campylobacterales bacterium]
MFDGMNFGDMGKMLEGLQEQAQKMQAELASREYTVKTGGGMVKVTINGAGEVIDIDIDDSLLEDKPSLQILLIAACNDAIKMVEDAKKQSAMNIFGGINPFAAR